LCGLHECLAFLYTKLDNIPVDTLYRGCLYDNLD
jgi:hypothetical protein